MSAATYGEMLSLAVREVGRGACALSTASNDDKLEELLDAQAGLLAAVVDHVEYLFGSELNRDFSRWDSDAHVEVATALWLQELRAMAYPAGASEAQPQRVICETAVHWRRATHLVRGAQELLATHIGPLDRWRSPDAWAINAPDGQRAGLARMAEVASVATLAAPTLLHRCEGRVPAGCAPQVESIRRHHAAGRMLSLGLGDLRRGDTDGARTIEQLQAVGFVDASSRYPLTRAEEHLRSLRQQTFHLESHEYVGAGVTKDVVTALAGAHGHLSVVLRACGADSSMRDRLEGWADASLAASKAWARVRTEWNVVDSPTAGDPVVTETAGAILRDLGETTRSGQGWKPATELLDGRPLAVRHSAQQSLALLAGTAASLEAIVVNQADREQLLGHAQALPRRFVTSDLTAVRARLDGRGAVLPRQMVTHLIDQTEAASKLTRDLAVGVSSQSADLLPVRDLPQPAMRRGAVSRYPSVQVARGGRNR